MVKQAIALADGDTSRVLIISIPDWGASPAGAGTRNEIAQQIDNFNIAQRQLALAEGLQFIDITSLRRKGLNDSSLIASDGLHFSAKMHQQWLQILYPALVKKLIF